MGWAFLIQEYMMILHTFRSTEASREAQEYPEHEPCGFCGELRSAKTHVSEEDAPEPQVARIVRGNITTTIIKVAPLHHVWGISYWPMRPAITFEESDNILHSDTPIKMWCVFELRVVNLGRNNWKPVIIGGRNWWRTPEEAMLAGDMYLEQELEKQNASNKSDYTPV